MVFFLNALIKVVTHQGCNLKQLQDATRYQYEKGEMKCPSGESARLIKNLLCIKKLPIENCKTESYSCKAITQCENEPDIKEPHPLSWWRSYKKK